MYPSSNIISSNNDKGAPSSWVFGNYRDAIVVGRITEILKINEKGVDVVLENEVEKPDEEHRPSELQKQ